MTLQGIHLENFKCFPRLELAVGSLTILTGFNAAGKSTALQALLLMAQALRQTPESDHLALNGPMVKLGNPGDVLCRSVTDTRVIKLGASSAKESFLWSLEASSDRRGILKLTEVVQRGAVGEGDRLWPIGIAYENPLLCGLQNMSFLSASRPSSTDAMPVPSDNRRPMWDVGSEGQYAAYILDQCSSDNVDVARRPLGDETQTVQRQVDGWLSRLFPGARSNANALDGVELMRLEFSTGRGAGWVKPSNIGYGLSYVFPLLVALMTAPKGAVLVVDSPEAHLHPRAQSVIGRLLAQVAGAGVQLLVETHSDHLLNGIRLGVRDGMLRPDDLALHFFTTDEEKHKVTTLSTDERGALSDWPAGFFDQGEHDLMQLSDWG